MRLREALIVLMLAGSIVGAPPRTRIQGNCAQGNNTVSTQGYASTTKVERSYPSCTVTVYNAGTAVISTIYSDDAGTAKANPFTAASDGWWFFYADDGTYDVRLSGGGIGVPFTRGDYALFDRRYQRSEGGGVNRNVKDRLKEIISVKDFGAVGNGTTNDAGAIQAAITAAESYGRPVEVVIPSGQYRLSAGLSVTKSNIYIRCSGRAELLLDAGVTGITISPTDSSTPYGEAVGGEVRNCWIKKNGSAVTGNGITIDAYGEDPKTIAPIHIHLIANKIHDMGGHGIYLTDNLVHNSGPANIRIERNEIRGCAGNGVRLDKAHDNISIIGNNIQGNISFGIYVDLGTGAINTVIERNTMAGNVEGGIVLLGASLVKILHNELEQQANPITGTNQAMIDVRGPAVGNATIPIIEGNNINGDSTGAAPYLIRLDNVTGAWVRHNQFVYGNCAVQITGDAQSSLVESNIYVPVTGVFPTYRRICGSAADGLVNTLTVRDDAVEQVKPINRRPTSTSHITDSVWNMTYARSLYQIVSGPNGQLRLFYGISAADNDPLASVDLYVPGSAATGTVNTNGTAVTRVSGTAFSTDWGGSPIIINSNFFVIASVAGANNLTLAESAGVSGSVAYTHYNYLKLLSGTFAAGIATPRPLTVNLNVAGDARAFTADQSALDSASFLELVGRAPGGAKAAAQVAATTTGGLALISGATPGTKGTTRFLLEPTNGYVGINSVPFGGAPSYFLHVFRVTDGDVVGFTDATGTCTVNPNNTALICASDERMKKNITPLDENDALARVLRLSGVAFDWKSGAAPSRHVGLVAQDVETVIPEAVHEFADGTKGVAQTALIPYLIQAIKAQQQEIEQLKAKAGR